MSPEDDLKKFDLAYAQYTSIDAKKCEHFCNLVQGFLSFQKDKLLAIVPFEVKTKEEMTFLRDEIKSGKFSNNGPLVGVSFVQHYIHYGSGH